MHTVAHSTKSAIPSISLSNSDRVKKIGQAVRQTAASASNLDKSTGVCLRAVTRKDLPTVVNMIHLLAREEGYEASDVLVSEGSLLANVFGSSPTAQIVIAEVAGEIAGFALYYTTFSSMLGRVGLHLDDLYILPKYRHSGIGTQFMHHLAQETTKRSGVRLEWWVLENNSIAKRFYKSLGASQVEQVSVFRLENKAVLCESHKQSFNNLAGVEQ